MAVEKLLSEPKKVVRQLFTEDEMSGVTHELEILKDKLNTIQRSADEKNKHINELNKIIEQKNKTIECLKSTFSKY